MVSEGCFSFTKYLLFLFNLIFFFIGILLASAGFWIIFGKTSFLNLRATHVVLGGTLVSAGTMLVTPGLKTHWHDANTYLLLGAFCLTAFYGYGPTLMSIFPFACLLLIGGIGSMLLGFFGCLGALKEVKCMLGTYFVALAILLAIEIVAGVLFFTQRTTIEHEMGGKMVELMKSSKQNTSHLEDFNTAFNSIQRENKCCGWDTPNDWIDTPCSCYNSTGLLFNSSEQHNFSMECICPAANGTSASCRIYQEGCKEVINRWLSENTPFILAMLLAVAAVQLSGMTLSMCLYRWIIVDCDLLNHYL